MAAALAVGLVLASACDAGERSATPMAARPNPREIALAQAPGDSALDEQIRALQRRIPTSRVPAADFERLGFMFVARAREGDAGSYNLALQAALAIESYEPNSQAALLLRGHALHSLHHFADAERAARALVAARGLPVDHGLLGDVLVDRGELDEAITAYQKMMDLKPDAHAYVRAAHVRYLKGDLSGALDAMHLATRAVSPRNRENFAWTWAKLGSYQLQAGTPEQAKESVRRALEVYPDSEPAQRLGARIDLSESNYEPALAALRKALAHSQHPDVLWMLVETTRALGLAAQAADYEARLLASGASEDPRATALYLATKQRDLPRAERLVREELAERHDIFTYEALALVQSSRADHVAALASARRSLSSGCGEPRLYYHAGWVAARAGDVKSAREWLARASAGAALLLPSQREELRARTAALSSASG